MVSLGPGFGDQTDQTGKKYGKVFHRSAEPLYVELSPFLVPKASAIHASMIRVC